MILKMLTEREALIVGLLRLEPLISTEEMARRLEMTRDAVRVHLSNLGGKGVILGRGYVLREERSVVVVGGANIDVKAQSGAAPILATSNPGTSTSSAGGVGRNIAENLSRLGTQTHLLAAVGTDALGDRLMAETRSAGVHVDRVSRTASPTGTYTAVLDDGGELIIAVSSMAAVAELDPGWITASKDLIANSSFLVLDGNLRIDTARAALDLAQQSSIPVLVDPVSDAKSELLGAVIEPALPVFVVTPNRSELSALTGCTAISEEQVVAAARELHRRGVKHVWVRLGPQGSLLSSMSGDVSTSDLMGSEFVVVKLQAESGPIVDVTGAGDAMAAAFVHAFLDGRSVENGVRFAHAAASLTIESEHTVRPDLSPSLVESRLKRSESQCDAATSPQVLKN